MKITGEQMAVCIRFGVDPLPPKLGTMVGVAVSRGRELKPLIATRQLARPTVGTCGGEVMFPRIRTTTSSYRFTSSTSRTTRRKSSRILLCRPGWGGVLAPNYEDVWRDEAFLTP
jgi:hypothetical protein